MKTESRIDVPGDGGRVRAGRVAVAGVAWAQHRGIDGVAGAGGRGRLAATATLGAEATIDTWRQWVFGWDARPGKHDAAGARDRPHRGDPDRGAGPARAGRRHRLAHRDGDRELTRKPRGQVTAASRHPQDGRCRIPGVTTTSPAQTTRPQQARRPGRADVAAAALAGLAAGAVTVAVADAVAQVVAPSSSPHRRRRDVHRPDAGVVEGLRRLDLRHQRQARAPAVDDVVIAALAVTAGVAVLRAPRLAAWLVLALGVVAAAAAASRPDARGSPSCPPSSVSRQG